MSAAITTLLGSISAAGFLYWAASKYGAGALAFVGGLFRSDNPSAPIDCDERVDNLTSIIGNVSRWQVWLLQHNQKEAAEILIEQVLPAMLRFPEVDIVDLAEVEKIKTVVKKKG